MEDAAPICILEEGSKFVSFKLLSESIKQWERENFVQLYKRRSRTIQSAARRATKKKYNKDLEFSEIDYACIHGGRNLKENVESVQRPNQRFDIYYT